MCMKKVLCFLVLAAVSVALVGCKRSGQLRQNVSGKAGEVYVVMGSEAWSSALGEAVKGTLTAPCPALPQTEPLYDVTHITPDNFTKMFSIHRNLVLFNITSSVTEAGVVIRHDVWAQPQIVVRVNASSTEGALELWNENVEKILNAIEQAERDRIIANTIKYQNPALCEVVKEDFGAEMYFPSNYGLKKRTEDFVWIASETTHVMQGILLYKYKVANTDTEFTADKLLAMRNQILKDNVPGMFEGTYMTTAPWPVPELRYVAYKGRRFAELRGLWEVHKDFMGGPFVSHSFYSEDGSEIITLDAFVYAPKFDKRHYIRQVESILYSYKPLVEE